MLVRSEICEPETQEYLADLVALGDTIRTGAFNAESLPRLDRAARPKGLIRTFGPNPVSFAAARHTMELNGQKKCMLHQCGVGRTPAAMHPRVAKPTGIATAARARIVSEQADNRTVEISIEALDDLVPPDRVVSAIQRDIEGHEIEATEDAVRNNLDSAPVIIVEAKKPRHQRLDTELPARVFPRTRPCR